MQAAVALQVWVHTSQVDAKFLAQAIAFEEFRRTVDLVEFLSFELVLWIEIVNF